MLVDRARVLLVVVATKIVPAIKHAIIIIAKIFAIWRMHAVQTHYANSKIIVLRANVRLDSKEIQLRKKVVFEYQRHAPQPINVQAVTCALAINAMCLAPIQSHVQSVNVVPIINAPKYAIQIIIVYLVKYVMKAALASRAVKQMLIVHQRRFAPMVNVNVVVDLLVHHSVARISMNVLKNHVIQALFASIYQALIAAHALNRRLEIHITHLAAVYQINVLKTRIVRKIWNAYKEDVRILVHTDNAVEMLYAKPLSMAQSVHARAAI